MIDYSQGDKKWANYPYPQLPYCLKYNGCGPTVCADLIANMVNSKITPKDTAKWLVDNGYAVKGHGTAWAGMPKCLNHYGLLDKEFPTVKGSFPYFKKNQKGYALMGKGTRGGVTWTADGHYIAIMGYKEKNGKHYFYTLDSGNRGNDGWHSYEDTMYGMVNQIHVVKKIGAAKKTNKTTKKTTKTYKGFDISYVQNGLTVSDFKKAKKAGWTFVIARVGTILNGALYEDKEFKSKIKNAKAAGLKVGAYWYSKATDTKTAKKEAEFALSKVSELDYPLFIDYEDSIQRNLGKEKNKKICEAFCETVEKAGLQSGVYASYDWLTNRIAPIDKKYNVWLAQYPKATYKGRYDIHQYTSSGNVDGIGKIDCNTSTLAPKTCKKKLTVPEKAAEWAIKIANDNSFNYGKGGPKNWYHGRVRARQIGCYFCGTNHTGVKKAPLDSEWNKTYCCNCFVMAAYTHGGGLFDKCKNGSTKIEYWCNLKKDGKPIFKKVKTTVDKLEVGDILANGKHVKMYVGDGKVAHAKRQGWDAESICVENITKLGDYEVARYILG